MLIIALLVKMVESYCVVSNVKWSGKSHWKDEWIPEISVREYYYTINL